MDEFDTQLQARVAAARRNPGDALFRRSFAAWLDAHAAELEAWLPPAALHFGVLDPAKRAGRIRFLRLLLLHGYLPPRVEQARAADWNTGSINVAIIPAYFYAHALSLLEAGLARRDVAVLLAAPDSVGYAPCVAYTPAQRSPVALRYALMLDARGLVWRQFDQPVPVHYLLPIDNYYRAKFRLVEAFGACGVPMPGSAAIREVCEDKRRLSAIAGNIPGLRLARELCLDPQHAPIAGEQLARFCAEHKMQSIVTKPVDAFGGADVQFWHAHDDAAALHEYVQNMLAAGRSLLVQERIPPLPTRLQREWNVRQYVLRCGPDDMRSAWKRVRIGHGVINTTRGAESVTVEQLIAEMDLPPAHLADLVATLRSTDTLAIEVLRHVERYVQHNNVQPPGSHQSPDLLALDFMIAPDAGGGFAVYLNEINDFASGGMRDYEVLAHRQAFPDAPAIQAWHAFSLAPAILDLARWRGSMYRQRQQHT